MTGTIIKQMWNRRRANTWIFIELILVTFFMWKVIDPVFVILANKSIEEGFNADKVFRFDVAEYASNHGLYSAEAASDSIRTLNYLRIYDIVRRYPGVESAVITLNTSHPYSGSYNGGQFYGDTLKVSSTQHFSFYQDGEFFKTFRIKDYNTGLTETLDNNKLSVPSIYLSHDAERKMFPDGRTSHSKITTGNRKYTYEVAGITNSFKFETTDQPIPIVFIPDNKVMLWGFPYSSQICFRVKDDVNMARFAEEFKQQMTSQARIGNYYYLRLTDFNVMKKDLEFATGVTNTLRLQVSLVIFFLICTFLGIAGTFWLRSEARTGEIGLRMALGNTSAGVVKEFLTEAWLLTTFAWIIGIAIVLQTVFHSGFALPSENPSPEFIQNRAVPHFLIVSFIVYALMMVITMVGTWIPARKASKISPSDALRDE